MVTTSCDEHALLNRLHKPDPDLPPDAQDKRSLVQVEPGDWDQWLTGTVEDALQLVKVAQPEVFDLADAAKTDAVLAGQVR